MAQQREAQGMVGLKRKPSSDREDEKKVKTEKVSDDESLQSRHTQKDYKTLYLALKVKHKKLKADNKALQGVLVAIASTALPDLTTLGSTGES